MSLFRKTETDKKPVIFSTSYDIGAPGMQKLHPFDMKKYSHVFNELVRRGLIERGQEMAPKKMAPADLASVHTKEYLGTFDDKTKLAQIFEVPLVAKLPLWLTKKIILDPMLHQAGGSVMAGHEAMKTGWAINLGGGFHHAAADRGHGFCAIADITIAINKLRAENAGVKKVMIVDLDAHQGDGHERDFKNDKDVYILDMYNRDVFPGDMDGRKRMNIDGGVASGMQDAEYLEKLKDALAKAKAEFKPDVIFYVAGSDIMTGDPLGALSVSPAGMIKRDEMVFGHALAEKIPVVMMLAGGYQPDNAGFIADSIENLDKKFGLLKGPKP